MLFVCLLVWLFVAVFCCCLVCLFLFSFYPLLIVTICGEFITQGQFSSVLVKATDFLNNTSEEIALTIRAPHALSRDVFGLILSFGNRYHSAMWWIYCE